LSAKTELKKKPN